MTKSTIKNKRKKKCRMVCIICNLIERNRVLINILLVYSSLVKGIGKCMPNNILGKKLIILPQINEMIMTAQFNQL